MFGLALDQLSLFVTALAVVYLVPGPDMILVLQTGAARGRSAALAVAAGLAVARASHVALSAVGLAALIQASDLAYEAVRHAGAAYLVYLGVKLLRAPSLRIAADAPEIAALSHAEAFRAGLLTNLMNPKALLFCSILLPQFVHPEAGPTAPQFAALGLLLVLTGLLFDLVFAALGDRIGAAVHGSRWAERAERWLFGSLLIAFGVRLAWA
ncbi:LysE family translocator [Chthonobacter rhizosphaerae]|uniref:LysE family translocator n=1 Tax=Chthonobacter rhizosphaerae TaxID=2735553 RepID=UPI0015EED2B3|nr:LysE family translocator [Chthonobacter rhizosphaerae]